MTKLWLAGHMRLFGTVSAASREIIGLSLSYGELGVKNLLRGRRAPKHVPVCCFRTSENYYTRFQHFSTFGYPYFRMMR
jgi:hypothetical protein